jgi:hypothetical protein
MPILASALQAAYGIISSIPTLLVVDGDTLQLLTSGGCPWVRKDAAASAFPWRGQSTPPSDFGSSSAIIPMLVVSLAHLCILPSQHVLFHPAHHLPLQVAAAGLAAVRVFNWYKQRST